MATKGIITKIELDPETDLDLRRWADEQERSKRRQVAVLLRRLISLRKNRPDELKRLELAN